eukprot:1043971-Alexandrium_andersonii.AAC.1
MSASLVGSEMCIRDRYLASPAPQPCAAVCGAAAAGSRAQHRVAAGCGACLLYTSDAADDM